MADTPLKTPQQLLEHASANAKAVKQLNSTVSVASGAIVGGPAPSSTLGNVAGTQGGQS